MATGPDIYRFGPYEIRTRTREIYKSGTRLKVRPQPFQVLSVLIERAGNVVTREELRQLLWPAETFVDFEHGLNTSINELRRVLSDSASSPRYIETLPKLGYRLIAPVEQASQAAGEEMESQPQPPLAAPEPAPAMESRISAGAPRPRRIWLLPAAALLIVIVAAGAYWAWRGARARSLASGRQIGVAVLPFENLTGDAAQDYLSDGLTEEMIAQLGRTSLQPLRVIARTSVMHYKHSQERVRDIGRELDVQ